MTNDRKAWLLERLRGRTDAQGRPRSGYAQNVTAIKAELETYENKTEEEDNGKPV